MFVLLSILLTTSAYTLAGCLFTLDVRGKKPAFENPMKYSQQRTIILRRVRIIVLVASSGFPGWCLWCARQRGREGAGVRAFGVGVRVIPNLHPSDPQACSPFQKRSSFRLGEHVLSRAPQLFPKQAAEGVGFFSCSVQISTSDMCVCWILPPVKKALSSQTVHPSGDSRWLPTSPAPAAPAVASHGSVLPGRTSSKPSDF